MAEEKPAWNPEVERPKWAAHDSFFCKHFGRLYEEWVKLGFQEPQWAQNWAQHVNQVMTWGDVQLRCLPVWRVNWIPDINVAAVCDPFVVPCGLIHTKITYMPCPDDTFPKNPELYDRWKIAMVGDMMRIKYAVPTGVNPAFRTIAQQYADYTLGKLGLIERLKELTHNYTQQHRCHPYGHIINPHPLFLKRANRHLTDQPPPTDPDKKSETPKYNLRSF